MKSVTVNILVALVSLLVSFLLVEMFVRVFLPPPPEGDLPGKSDHRSWI